MCVANLQIYQQQHNNNTITLEQRVLLTMHSWFSFEFIRHQPSSKHTARVYVYIRPPRYFTFCSHRYTYILYSFSVSFAIYPIFFIFTFFCSFASIIAFFQYSVVFVVLQFTAHRGSWFVLIFFLRFDLWCDFGVFAPNRVYCGTQSKLIIRPVVCYEKHRKRSFAIRQEARATDTWLHIRTLRIFDTVVCNCEKSPQMQIDQNHQWFLLLINHDY